MAGVVFTNRDIEITMRLYEYRLWASQTSDNLGIKITPMATRHGRSPDISDEDALALDRALMVVRSACYADYQILLFAYLRYMDDPEIGLRIGKSSSRVTSMRGAALKAWYCAWLAAMQKAA